MRILLPPFLIIICLNALAAKPAARALGPACPRPFPESQSAGRYLVGADLIRKRVEARPSIYKDARAPRNGIIDWDLPEACLRRSNPRCSNQALNGHGMGAAAIMFSPREGSVFSATPPETYDAERDVRAFPNAATATNEDIKRREREAVASVVPRTPRALERMQSRDVRVINYSGLMLFRGYTPEARAANDKILESIRRFTTDPRRLLVVAAGNEILGLNAVDEDMRQGQLRELERSVKNTGAIVVGAVDPANGDLTNRMNLEHVTVFAPTDNRASIAGRTTPPLGETSGATPLVSATLSDVLAILPALNKTQIVTLIQKTALPMTERGGFFNAYKLFRVAERLKEKCGNQSSECIDRLIHQSELYDFRDEAQRLEAAANFEGCPSAAAYDAAREAYLLNPVTENRARVDRALDRTRTGSYPRSSNSTPSQELIQTER